MGAEEALGEADVALDRAKVPLSLGARAGYRGEGNLCSELGLKAKKVFSVFL